MFYRIFMKIKREITYNVLSGQFLFLEIESNDDFCSLRMKRQVFVIENKRLFLFHLKENTI